MIRVAVYVLAKRNYERRREGEWLRLWRAVEAARPRRLVK